MYKYVYTGAKQLAPGVNRTFFQSKSINQTFGFELNKNEVGAIEWMESHFDCARECVVYKY